MKSDANTMMTFMITLLQLWLDQTVKYGRISLSFLASLVATSNVE